MMMLREYWYQFNYFSWPLFLIATKYLKLSQIVMIQQNKSCSHSRDSSTWYIYLSLSLMFLAFNVVLRALWNNIRKNQSNVFRMFSRNLIHVSLTVSILCEFLTVNEPHFFKWDLCYVAFLPLILMVFTFLYIRIVLQTQSSSARFIYFPFQDIVYSIFLFLQSLLFIYFIFGSGLPTFYPKTEYTNILVSNTPEDYALKSDFPLWVILSADAWTSASSSATLYSTLSLETPTSTKKSITSSFLFLLLHPQDGLWVKLFGITIWCFFLIFLNVTPCFMFHTTKGIQQYFETYNNTVLLIQQDTLFLLVVYFLIVPNIVLSVTNHNFQIFQTLNKGMHIFLKQQSKKEKIYPLLANLNIYIMILTFSVGILAFIMPVVQQSLLFILFIINWTSHISGIHHLFRIYMK